MVQTGMERKIVNPAEIHEIRLSGQGLTVEMVVAAARFGAHVTIEEKAVAAMQESRQLVEEIVEGDTPVYGINTGFGEFSKVRIGHDSIDQLQKNLIMSHSTATGQPLKEEVVRAMLLLRANALCNGFSGIRPQVVQLLVDMLNARVHPVVPEKGSLGASGDLAPLAHMVLPMLGMGEAVYQGERMSGAAAMEKAGLTPVSLKAKEGLALINGTQVLTSIGTLAFYDTLQAARMADIAVSLSMEALTALLNAFDPRVHAVRPHQGQSLVAANVRTITKDSPILAKSQNLRVQDAYAIRCTGQVHGAVRDTLDFIRRTIETELNSVTDNPILFTEEGDVISGGNFHGEPMAFAFDFLGIVCSELANISERRLERLVNPALSNGLPAFLTNEGGVNSGFMIVQYSAASMVSENKVLAHPASVDSIPSSANQEDHVSMGTTAARKAAQIVENTLSVIAMELMGAAQGIDLRGGEPSPVSRKVYGRIREKVDFWDRDREMWRDVAAMNELVRDGSLVEIVSKLCPDFQ